MGVKRVELSEGVPHDELTVLANRMLEKLQEEFAEELQGRDAQLYLTLESGNHAGSAQHVRANTQAEALACIVTMHIHGLQALMRLQPRLIAPIREWLMKDGAGH